MPTDSFAKQNIDFSHNDVTGLTLPDLSVDGVLTGSSALFFDNIETQGILITGSDGVHVGSTKVLGVQGSAIADATTEAEAVTQLNLLLAALRAHGLIAT